jgi:hypothetical protein
VNDEDALFDRLFEHNIEVIILGTSVAQKFSVFTSKTLQTTG